jgi:MOSC domain-containing protein
LEAGVETLGRVVEVRRYPVKSMRGELLHAAEVERRGLVGDRLWALRDGDGKLGSGKSTRRFRAMKGLLGLAARYDGQALVITFPDGTAVRGDDGSIHKRLSEAVGRRVELAHEAAVSHFDAAPIHLCTTASLDELAGLAAGFRIQARRFRPNLLVEVAAGGFVEDGWVGGLLEVGDQVRRDEPGESGRGGREGSRSSTATARARIRASRNGRGPAAQ